jgi:UDP-2-acetamido-2,6-beta-L-arabino-hexul-4-ose reductase
MKILITGANGFFGKNLVYSLKNKGYNHLIEIDRNSSKEDLIKGLLESDFVFHLAGVNRPKNEKEFFTGNVDFTKELVEILSKNNRKTPILFSSSIQALLDNPYGKSKREAEKILIDFSNSNGNKIFIFRLPNVFGKWSRPNYNSVVATFCYNIARDLPIEIHDPEKELTLVYIDDVINEFIKTMENYYEIETGFLEVKTTYKIKLKDLANKIYSFKEIRKKLKIPSFEDELTRKLYATFLSYFPENNLGYELEMKKDNRGWLSEFLKSNNFGQIFISKTKPGITRGNHWHHTKVEKFLVVQGKAMIRLRNIISNEIVEYEVSGEELRVIDIPPGYTHSITNIGEEELITLFWSSEIFNPEKPDTYYLEV